MCLEHLQIGNFYTHESSKPRLASFNRCNDYTVCAQELAEAQGKKQSGRASVSDAP